MQEIFWPVAMLLEHRGAMDAAARLMEAIEQVTAKRSLHTRDPGFTRHSLELSALLPLARSPQQMGLRLPEAAH
jgi:isocitrate/isopropylmalate dehydrogenase